MIFKEHSLNRSLASPCDLLNLCVADMINWDMHACICHLQCSAKVTFGLFGILV